MSRTKHHREYRKRDKGDLWSKRPMSMSLHTAENKRLSRQIERAQGKQIVVKAVVNPDLEA